jgi:hypothetical protein
MAGMQVAEKQVSGMYVRGRDACGRNAGNASGRDARGTYGRMHTSERDACDRNEGVGNACKVAVTQACFSETGSESILKY